ncbi:hypothetical protein E3Q22_03685 [Wallemia mellicola]|uniref:Uncharacterized protein n=1 Tax=Wallemia mellicola TaxID=1708541 RepID=A0A4T0SG84_9BASI|nr:hypothetical protein E3Q24_03640 [Wallemia mellicola]TIB71708.1 hypothetical protein E3Q23_03691 [Wallemia mellicola]TIB76133.1 hypothetical protein E3Q22_03685 [Wallemia mellicola]TIB80512.1 hypothetical protein E3Q21_03712 [Wallemia mellicola]TIB84548.1 hypothetical protein E3Q20_03639 [Wallemia mellicola]
MSVMGYLFRLERRIFVRNDNVYETNNTSFATTTPIRYSIANTVKQTVFGKDEKQKAEEKAEVMKEKAKATGDRVYVKGSDLAGEAKQGMSEAADSAQGNAELGKQKAEEKAEDVKPHVESASQKAKEFGHETAKKVSDASEKFQEKTK